MSTAIPPAKPQKPPKTPPPPPRKAPSPVYDDEDPPPPSDDEDDDPPPPSDDEDEEVVTPAAKPSPSVQSSAKSAPPPPPPPPVVQARLPVPPPRPSPGVSPALSPTAETARIVSSKPPPPPSPSVSSIRLSVAPLRPPPPGAPPVLPPTSSPPPPSSSVTPPKPTVSTRSPHESVSSVRSSSSSISPMRGFRPDSTASTMSTMTSLDPDEEILRMSGLYGVYENAILQNVLSKMNRDGKFEKNIFILTPDELMYFKMPAIKPNTMAATAVASLKTAAAADSLPAVLPPPPEPSRVIPLNTLLAMPLSDEDHPGKADKRVRTFKILAKQKSFYLRAASVPLKEQWLQAIQDCASSLQIQESGAIRDAAQTAPIYVSSESNCQICAKVFTFFVRKNHCHNCGKCVCEMCSRDKMRILKIDDKKLFRVCNPCGKELKSTRVYGTHRYNNEEDAAGES